MVNLRNMLIAALFCLWVCPSETVHAQRLKLPSFLPFKKKTQEVKPIRLSDKATTRIQNKPHSEKGVFDFLKPSVRTKPAKPASFNDKSKSFLQKTGDEFGRFTAETKSFLHDTWYPPSAKKAWWNQGPKLDDESIESLLAWPGQYPKTGMPPQVPHTARHYQTGEAVRQFK